MNSAQEQHIVVYWGRRGGGLDLFNLFVEECNERGISVISSSRPTVLKRDGETSPISFLNVRAWLELRKSLLEKASEGEYKSVVFIMSSPWDIFLGKRLEKSGLQVTRLIHDGKPHPGEIFPPSFWITLLARDCSRIVTLSCHVAGELTLNHGVEPSKILTCRFPVPKINYKKVANDSPKKKILLIGRGKKYQGQHLLEDAWNLTDKTNKELVIAGKGFKPNPKFPDIVYKNWWMTREEMIVEISSSALVVFPYTEASQSGTIPICRALGIPVVVTPVGGLIEQVEHRVTGLISAGTSSNSLVYAIEESMNLIWNINNVDEKISADDLIQGCLGKGI